MGLEYGISITIVFIACIIADNMLKTHVFKKHWKAFLITYVLGFIVGIPWDNIAVLRGHWIMSPEYTTGIALGYSPIESLGVLATWLLIPIISWEYFKKRK